ncbi:hypothetical protein RB595_005207 [Gaeumannomyces hyphopodioides]
METAGQTVSKRSVRAPTEEGADHKGAGRQSKRNSSCEDYFIPEDMERRGSTSSSKTAVGTEIYQYSSSTATMAVLADRMSFDAWADPTEPLSWNEDGKLMPLDPIKDFYNQSVPLEAGLHKASLPMTGRPTNFGVIVPGVYRCGYPQPEDFAFVEGLQLQTVVTLVNKELPKGYQAFLRANGIKHHIFEMKGTKKEDIPVKTMQAILRLVLDRRNHPMLIHCNHGKHRTGCVVGVVRKVTGWELSSILDEYKSFATPKERECDIRYISAFESANISPTMFANTSSLALRQWCFVRAAMLTIFILAVWFTSSSSFAWQPRNHFVDIR